MDLYTQIIESNKTLRHLSKHFMLLQSNNLGRKILNLDSVASMTFLLIKPLIQHPLKFVLYNANVMRSKDSIGKWLMLNSI